METLKQYGVRLRSLRKAKRLSVADVADKAGIHLMHLYALENGYKRPGLETCQRLAAALSIPLAKVIPPARGKKLPEIRPSPLDRLKPTGYIDE
jgi:XRE family transcriptional regulator, fatty acid utilization regulator